MHSLITRISCAGPVLALALGSLTAQLPIVGIWQFDETSGTTAADLGPYGNDGTLMNFPATPWVPGQFNNALMFDGVDDYVEIATNGGLPFYESRGEPFSICMWVNGSATNDVRVLSLSSSSSTTPLLTWGTGRTSNGTAAKLQVYRRSDDNLTYIPRYSFADVFDNTWHHVAYVEHSDYAMIFVDGQLDQSFAIDTGERFVSTDIVTLGAVYRPTSSSPACCHFTGMLDELQIYAYAISPADVATAVGGGIAGAPRPSLATYGVGCDSGNPSVFGPFRMHAFGSPALGGLIELRTSGGQAGTAPTLVVSLGTAALYDLSPFGATPDCVLYADPGAVLVSATMPPHDTFGSSVAGLPLPIPNIPLLSGLRLTFAAFDLAPNATATNGVLAVLGT